MLHMLKFVENAIKIIKTLIILDILDSKSRRKYIFTCIWFFFLKYRLQREYVWNQIRW